MSLLRITGYRLNKKIDYHYEDGYQHYIKHILAFFTFQASILTKNRLLLIKETSKVQWKQKSIY